MRPRRLVLPSGTWRFLVGGVRTTVWSPSGRRWGVMNWEISGAAPGTHVCGDALCSASGYPVTPGLLRAFIEAHPHRFASAAVRVGG